MLRSLPIKRPPTRSTTTQCFKLRFRTIQLRPCPVAIARRLATVRRRPVHAILLPAEMITFLRGKLVEVHPTQITVDVNGVGYEVLIPLSSFDKLPGVGNDLTILTHLAIREDAHVIYGFMSAAERDLFRLLIHTVSGIGPKIALNILSGMNVTALRSAVASGDVKSLSQINGVGRKTAERIVVELKDKIGQAAAAEVGTARPATVSDTKINDAVLALVALGFKQPEAHDAVRAALAVLGQQASVEQLVRAALKKG